MKISIYDSTGQILRNVDCPEDMVLIQAQDGESVIEGDFSAETHFIDTALLQAVIKPPKPDGSSVFDTASRSWVPIQRTAAELIATSSVKRAQLLAQCDWTQLPDVPAATQAKWLAYRQALRDISLQAGYPQTIVWPATPV